MLRRLATLAVALVALGAPAAARAQDTVPAFAANSLKSEWHAGYNTAGGLDRNGLADLDLMGTAKLGMYRARFRQDRVQNTTAGWTQLDTLAGQAARRGITLLPVLMNMPNEVYTPPRNNADFTAFGSFAAAAAQRYGPNGAFWATCGCPYQPVHVWQVWNEPNLATFWSPVSATQYGALVRSVRTRLRAVDPTARI